MSQYSELPSRLVQAAEMVDLSVLRLERTVVLECRLCIREEWEAQNRGSMTLFDEIDVDEDGRLSSDELVLYEKRCCQAKSDVGVTISMQEMEMQDLTEGDHEDKDDEENPYPLVVG